VYNIESLKYLYNEISVISRWISQVQSSAHVFAHPITSLQTINKNSTTIFDEITDLFE